ncbi:MAG TPA: peptide chain release factor-like protein [Chlamydiales bacterium]|nr:peptide chain release factor-like protein [Chlamydiales bacterium]
MHKDSKEQELADWMKKLGIKEADIIEKFILGSGKGGQKINKTSSCVYLKHLPTGLEVKCMRNRSRERNRLLARRQLCERLEDLLFQEKSAKQQAIEKIRRQKKRRSRRSKEKILKEKKYRSEIKKLRKENIP